MRLCLPWTISSESRTRPTRTMEGEKRNEKITGIAIKTEQTSEYNNNNKKRQANDRIACNVAPSGRRRVCAHEHGLKIENDAQTGRSRDSSLAVCGPTSLCRETLVRSVPTDRVSLQSRCIWLTYEEYELQQQQQRQWNKLINFQRFDMSDELNCSGSKEFEHSRAHTHIICRRDFSRNSRVQEQQRIDGMNDCNREERAPQQ